MTETETVVRERPILFSGPMVRAILDGRKTQTRRVMKPQPPEDCGRFAVEWYAPIAVDRHGEEYPGPDIFGAYSLDGEWGHRCPYGVPGDRLWVREGWQQFFDDEMPPERPRGPRGTMGVPAQPERESRCFYRADGEVRPHDQFGHPVWLSPIHMPRWASRLTLAITDVRVQRLREIGDNDHGYPRDIYAEGVPQSGDPLRQFIDLWDSLNAKRGHGWDQNPWVWCVSFQTLTPNAALELSSVIEAA
jgi:hypothetical protein